MPLTDKTPEDKAFITAFNMLQEMAHRNAIDKGFWNNPRNDGEAIALMHSELSEALEAMRHGNPPDDKIPDFSGVEAELADVVIRIFDLAGGRKYRIAEAILEKMYFNSYRPHLHGKLF